MAEYFFPAPNQMGVSTLNTENGHLCNQLFGLHNGATSRCEKDHQSQIDHYFATSSAACSNTTALSRSFVPTVSSLRPPTDWSGIQAADYQSYSTASYHNLHSMKNDGTADTGMPYVGLWSDALHPASAQSFELQNGMALESQIYSSREIYHSDMQIPHTVNHDFDEDAAELTESMSRSPTVERKCFNACHSASEYPPEPTDCPHFKTLVKSENDDMEESVSAAEKRHSEEPYAKLIYKALLSAPNHSMVLQEIYQWFLENTNKGDSISTGWRNSIRHNLSMNAAFRKTNRAPNGDDLKKASVWVLDPFAVKNGVTPTTRYRKTGKKTMKPSHAGPGGVRCGNLSEVSARKTKGLRQGPGEINEESKRRSLRGRFPAQSLGSTAIRCPRMSPSTPDDRKSSDSNPYNHSKHPSLEEFVSLEDIHGLLIDDDMVTCGDRYAIYGERYPYMWSGFHL